MLCTIIYSDDVSLVFEEIDDLSEQGLREMFGFVDGEEDATEAEYELTIRDDGKRVHTFYTEDGYITDAIWIVEG